MVMEEVSVVIVTYRRHTELKKCIQSVLKQTLAVKEIVVVNNAPNDESLVSFLQDIEFSELLKVLVNKENSLTSGRNLGVKNCSGSFVLLVDDDVELSPNYVVECLEYMNQNPSAKGVQGHFSPARRSRLRNLISAAYLDFTVSRNRCRVKKSISASYPLKPEGVVPCQWLSGSNQFYRAEVLKVIAWDEKLKRYSEGEDLDHSFRVWRQFKGGLYLLPTALVYHHESEVGRTGGYELVLMHVGYTYYLSHKLFPTSIRARLSYLLNNLGNILMVCSRAVRRHKQVQGNAELWSLLRAYKYLFGIRKNLRVGNLLELNTQLTRLATFTEV